LDDLEKGDKKRNDIRKDNKEEDQKIRKSITMQRK
jgi:hypothetical protein